MKRILLICSAGMSTSLLVTKMNQAASKKGIEVDINAIPEADFKNHRDKCDVVLLGPQVRFLLSRIRGEVEGKGIPVELINTVDYGMMNGEKVLNQALSLLDKK